MKEIIFKVENKDFFADGELYKKDRFIIKSIPKPYELIWDDKNNPKDVIINLLNEKPKNLLLIDKNVYEILKLDIPEERVFLADAIEQFKTLDGVIKVIEFLQTKSFSKGENLIVVGGGIIEDVGAFVGACFKRGIDWIYFPTTLLSMCDSCIGGKTGINHNNAKNQLALFSAPSKVIININFLNTLGEKELKAGMGEIIKLCITGGKYFIEEYKKRIVKGEILSFIYYKELIMCSLSVKKAIIEEDEFELNYRRSLNYGHTIGHAIEVLADYEIPHGVAVVLGMLLINELSYKRGMLSKEENNDMKEMFMDLIDKETFDIMKHINTDELADLLSKDKKTLSKVVNFVFLKSIGNMVFYKIEVDDKLTQEISEIIKNEFN